MTLLKLRAKVNFFYKEVKNQPAFKAKKCFSPIVPYLNKVQYVYNRNKMYKKHINKIYTN